MNTKTILGGLAIAIALVLSVLAISKTPVQKVVERVMVGATPGDVVNSRTFTINGVTSYYDSLAYNTATSTFCVTPRPSATSTIKSFTAKNTSATSTTVLYVLEKRTNPFAPLLSAATSSSVVAWMTLAASDDGVFSVIATTTATDGTSQASADFLEVTPSQYLVFYGKNGGAGSIPQSTSIGTVFTGQCNSVMQEVQ